MASSRDPPLTRPIRTLYTLRDFLSTPHSINLNREVTWPPHHLHSVEKILFQINRRVTFNLTCYGRRWIWLVRTLGHVTLTLQGKKGTDRFAVSGPRPERFIQKRLSLFLKKIFFKRKSWGGKKSFEKAKRVETCGRRCHSHVGIGQRLTSWFTRDFFVVVVRRERWQSPVDRRRSAQLTSEWIIL